MRISNKWVNKQYGKLRRKVMRLARRKNFRRCFAYAAIIIAVTSMGIMREKTMMDVNYTNLLNTIAQGESKGNYNAYFGNASNTTINFTAMTVGEVLNWQRQYVEQGNASNAVGKYQFIEPTLRGLVGELKIEPKSKFDAHLQDRLAIRLLERRGVHEYVSGHISREQLAHNLSKEWAALPRVIGGNPQSSYYAGDGLNHVQVSVDEVMVAIESLHESKRPV